MELFQHSGFQTVEFALMVVLAVRLLISRSLTSPFLVLWSTLAAIGLAGLPYWNDLLPDLPFFVNAWRLLATLFGAALAGEFLEEWRGSPGGLGTAHTLGVATSLVGTGLAWLNSYSVSSACLLLVGFILLGYCARGNRMKSAT